MPFYHIPLPFFFGPSFMNNAFPPSSKLAIHLTTCTPFHPLAHSLLLWWLQALKREVEKKLKCHGEMINMQKMASWIPKSTKRSAAAAAFLMPPTNCCSL
jgi:hypothetical protein